MSDQRRTVQDILMERLETIQGISEITAEHLRLTQKQSGMQVLDMAEDDENPGVAREMGRTEGALETCKEKIDALERRLAELDEELEAKVEGGET
ncbi:MAG: hypothetical protein KI788_06470 [Mameliella sp.]|nr:hypothetical protein [Mameliella sp.]